MRQPRIHIERGVYYIVLRSASSRLVCRELENYAAFQALLRRACERFGATPYAYCFEPRAAHVAFQVSAAPASQIVHSLASLYTRQINRRYEERGTLFRSHHRALLVDPAYLHRLAHYIHWIAVSSSLSDTAADYPYSSYRAYLDASQPWLDTREVLRLLRYHTSAARRAYVELAQQPPDPADACGFAQGMQVDRRVYGSPAFLRTLPLKRATNSDGQSLDRIIESVRLQLGVRVEDLKSHSRRRPLPLARALIAWLARERGIATVSQVAEQFHHHWSTVRWGIERYLVEHPELFTLRPTPNATPLLRVPRHISGGSCSDEAARLSMRHRSFRQGGGA